MIVMEQASARQAAGVNVIATPFMQ